MKDTKTSLPERAARDTRGAALVEAALIIPLLLLLGLGAIEFGYLVYQAHVVKCGLRDGARYLAYVPQTQRTKAVTGLSSQLTYENYARDVAINGMGSSQKLSGWTVDTIVITYRTITSPQAEVIRFETSFAPNTVGLMPALVSIASSFYGKSIATPRLSIAHEEVALDY